MGRTPTPTPVERPNPFDDPANIAFAELILRRGLERRRQQDDDRDES